MAIGPNRLHVEIGGVDVIAAGAFDLTQLELTPTGWGNALSTARLYLTKKAGGITILGMQEVKIWLSSRATGITVWRYFGGYVVCVESGVEGGEKTWRITCQGYDLQLDALMHETPLRGTIAGTNFQTQILRVMSFVQPPGTPGLQYINLLNVPNWASGVGLAHKSWKYATARQMIQDVCLSLKAAVPTIDPRFSIFPSEDATIGWLDPYLAFWDAASTPSPTYYYTADTPSGLYRPMYKPKRRKLDSTQLTTRGAFLGADGLESVREDAAAITAHPNPMSPDRGWKRPVVKNEQWTTQADLDAAGDGYIAARRYPRESYNFRTRDPVRPGLFVAIKDSYEALVDYVLPVAEVAINFRNPNRPLTDVTCGNRRLRLGEEEEGALQAPVERDLVPPDPPVLLAPLESRYNLGTDTIELHINWTPPDAADLDGFEVRWRTRVNGGAWGSWHSSGIGIPAGTNDYWIEGLTPSDTGQTWEVYYTVQAYDTSRNFSALATPRIDPIISRPNPPPPTSPHLDTTGYPPVGYGRTFAGGDAQVAFTLPSPAQDFTRWQAYDDGTNALLLEGEVAGIRAWLYTDGLPLDVPIRMELRSRTRWGRLSATPNSVIFTIPTPSPAPPTGLAHKEWPSATGPPGTLQIGITWSHPAGGAPIWYDVRYRSTARGVWYSERIDGARTEYIITTWPEGRQIQVDIASVNIFGDDGTPASLTFTPSSGRLPPTPIPWDYSHPEREVLGWGPDSGVIGTATYAIDTATTWQGATSLKVHLKVGSTLPLCPDPRLAAEPGREYHLKVNYFGTSSNLRVGVLVSYWNSAGSLISTDTPLPTSTVPPTSGDWGELDTQVTTPANTRSVTVRLYSIGSLLAVDADVFWAGLVWEEAKTAAGLGPGAVQVKHLDLRPTVAAPIEVKDPAGVVKLAGYYSAATDAVHWTGDVGSGATQQRFETQDGALLILDLTDSILNVPFKFLDLLQAGGSFGVVGNSAWPTTDLVDGMGWYRNDLRRWGSYDQGADIWLGEEKELSLTLNLVAELPPWTATSGPYFASFDSGIPPYFVRWTTFFYVSDPQDISNHFVLSLQTAFGGTVLASWNTAAYSSGIWGPGPTINSFTQVGGGDTAVYFRIDVVGAPGLLRASPNFIYRPNLTGL